MEKEFANLKITADKIIDMEENPFSEECENVIILNLKKFNALEDVIKSRLILYTINRLLGNTQGIQKIHIDDILELCKKKENNNNYNFFAHFTFSSFNSICDIFYDEKFKKRIN